MSLSTNQKKALCATLGIAAVCLVTYVLTNQESTSLANDMIGQVGEKVSTYVRDAHAAMMNLRGDGADASLSWTKGSPPSGEGQGELCSDHLFNCLEGYAKLGDTLKLQFQRVVDWAVSDKDNSGELAIAVRKCINLDKITSAISPVVKDNLGSLTDVCTANSKIWNNLQSTFTLYGANKSVCPEIQQAFMNAANECYTFKTALAAAAIAGIAIGGVIGVCLLGAGAYYIVKNKCDSGRLRTLNFNRA